MPRRVRRPLLISLPLATALVGIALFAGASPGLAEEEALPLALAQRLTEPLEREVAELAARRNEDGDRFMRGSYTRPFQPLEDGGYQVGFFRDTASKDSLLTERFRLTLRKEPARDAWTIAERKLEDSVTLLHRPDPTAAEFSRFESFAISREGMTIRGGAGSLYQVPRNGKADSLVIVAPDMTYSYVPPIEQDKSVWAIVMKEKKSDLEFSPERMGVDCDPVTCGEMLRSFKGLQKAERSAIDAGLEKAYADDLSERRGRLSEQGFSDFSRDFEPDRRFCVLWLKKPLVDQGLALTTDSLAPKEVSFSASGVGRVFAYHSEATRQKGISPLDLERRDDLEARYYDLQGIIGTVEMGLEDAEKVRGDLTFELTTKVPLKEIPFFIARTNRPGSEGREATRPTFVVNLLQDGEGRDLTWVRTGPVSGVVVLPEPVEAGTPISIRLAFENTDAILKFTPSYSYVDRGGWLPFVRVNDMIDILDLTVKVPRKYKTLGVGALASTVVEGDATVTRWTSDVSINFPTVVFGEYIEDKPEVKATKSDKSAIPIAIHVDRQSAATEIRPKQLQALGDDAANAINLYSAVFGVDYPFTRLDLVNDPTRGLAAQSPPTMVYVGSDAFRSGAAVEERAFQSGSALFVKSVVAHEVGHQWWGGLVGFANARNYWFVESLAEYSSALFVEQRYGREDYLRHVQEWRRQILESTLTISVQDADTLSNLGPNGRRAAIYAKGPYAFHIMRSTWGDEKFFAFLKQLAQELQGREIVTREIQQVAEKAFGGTMEWFFDQWIRGVGLPEYTFAQTSRKAEDGGFLVEGTIAQRVLIGAKQHVLPGRHFTAVVPIVVSGKGGKTYRVPVKVSGPSTPFKFKVPEAPTKVEFNAEGEVLAHDVIVRAGA